MTMEINERKNESTEKQNADKKRNQKSNGAVDYVQEQVLYSY